LSRNNAEGFTVRFLEAVTWEAEDARGLCWTMEREWRAARTVVSRRLGSRSTSRLPQAVDVLAASPLLSVSALARALGCTVEGASGMLDELARLEVVAEVTGGSEPRKATMISLTIRCNATSADSSQHEFALAA